MITDLEYPYRPAFTLITKILDEQAGLSAQLPTPGGSSSSANPSMAASGGLAPAQKGKLEATLQQYLVKYQDPTQADTIMKVQKELDETKIVLHKTIESVLERGEKIDNLVERSNALSNQSKMFYRTAKKVSCARGLDWSPRELITMSLCNLVLTRFFRFCNSKTLVACSCNRPNRHQFHPIAFEAWNPLGRA